MYIFCARPLFSLNLSTLNGLRTVDLPALFGALSIASVAHGEKKANRALHFMFADSHTALQSSYKTLFCTQRHKHAHMRPNELCIVLWRIESTETAPRNLFKSKIHLKEMLPLIQHSLPFRIHFDHRWLSLVQFHFVVFLCGGPLPINTTAHVKQWHTHKKCAASRTQRCFVFS